MHFQKKRATKVSTALHCLVLSGFLGFFFSPLWPVAPVGSRTSTSDKTEIKAHSLSLSVRHRRCHHRHHHPYHRPRHPAIGIVNTSRESSKPPPSRIAESETLPVPAPGRRAPALPADGSAGPVSGASVSPRPLSCWGSSAEAASRWTDGWMSRRPVPASTLQLKLHV